MPIRSRRPKGPAGGQFSPEDRPDDPPLSEDELLRQATSVAGAADPEGEATGEPEDSEDENEIKRLREHFRRGS